MYAHQWHRVALLVTLFLLYHTILYSQDKGDKVIITLLSGGTLDGTVIDADDQDIHITLPAQGIYHTSIPRYEIKDILIVDNLKNALVPEPARYYWGPSAYAVKPERLYYKNYMVFWNELEYGIDERWAIAGGTILPTFLFVTTSYRVPLQEDGLNLKFGLTAGTTFGSPSVDNTRPVFALVYGVATYGPIHRSVSLGTFYGLGGNTLAGASIGEQPGIYAAGRLGLKRNVSVQAEAYIFRVLDRTVTIPIISMKYKRERGGIFSFGIVYYQTSLEGDDLIFPALGYSTYFD